MKTAFSWKEENVVLIEVGAVSGGRLHSTNRIRFKYNIIVLLLKMIATGLNFDYLFTPTMRAKPAQTENYKISPNEKNHLPH